MLLSQTSQYAVRATVHLLEQGGGPAHVGEIAEALGIPRNYLSKILHQLARAGVLASERGRGGGFRLAEGAETLSLAQVLEPLEPSLGQRRCLLGRPECTDVDPCAAHESWNEIAERIRAFLEGTTLTELARTSAAADG